MTPVEIMTLGDGVVGPVLRGAGFTVDHASNGTGSGGDFAQTRWVRGDQYIDLSVRRALGAIVVGWGSDEFPLEAVVEVLFADCAYPGFSGDPLDGFRHLAADLAGPLALLISEQHETVHDILRHWVPRRVLP